MFCVVVEETDRVITERRMGTLRELAAAASDEDRGRGLYGGGGTLARNRSTCPSP